MLRKGRQKGLKKKKKTSNNTRQECWITFWTTFAPNLYIWSTTFMFAITQDMKLGKIIAILPNHCDLFKKKFHLCCN